MSSKPHTNEDQAAAIAAEFPGAEMDDLYDDVHDTASREASAANNDGPRAQIAYLLNHGHTADDIRTTLARERQHAAGAVTTIRRPWIARDTLGSYLPSEHVSPPQRDRQVDDLTPTDLPHEHPALRREQTDPDAGRSIAVTVLGTLIAATAVAGLVATVTAGTPGPILAVAALALGLAAGGTIWRRSHGVCQACGHQASLADPLTTSRVRRVDRPDSRYRVHHRHTTDPASGLYRGQTRVPVFGRVERES